MWRNTTPDSLDLTCNATPFNLFPSSFFLLTTLECTTRARNEIIYWTRWLWEIDECTYSRTYTAPDKNYRTRFAASSRRNPSTQVRDPNTLLRSLFAPTASRLLETSVPVMLAECTGKTCSYSWAYISIKTGAACSNFMSGAHRNH